MDDGTRCARTSGAGLSRTRPLPEEGARELIEKMRQAAKADRARGELDQKTGLRDPALLKELQDLGFTPDTVVLLPLVPMLEVAWAEGGITPAERDLLVQFARGRGVVDDSVAGQQLSAWMTHPPDPSVFVPRQTPDRCTAGGQRRPGHTRIDGRRAGGVLRENRRGLRRHFRAPARQYLAGREVTPGGYRLRFEDAPALSGCVSRRALLASSVRRVRLAEPAPRV